MSASHLEMLKSNIVHRKLHNDNKNTFDIKPIKDLITRYTEKTPIGITL